LQKKRIQGDKIMESYVYAISVPAITAIVYWIINLIKYAANNNEKLKRFIPLIAAGLGVVLGVVSYYSAPGVIIAQNPLFATVIGGASGLSATGMNQIIKQLGKGEDDK
jgi:hypothetical protein